MRKWLESFPRGQGLAAFPLRADGGGIALTARSAKMKFPYRSAR
jgi:hypothetical protein